MPAESMNGEIIYVVISALPILLLIVLLDRYLARRRGLAANADYVVRIQNSRDNSELHRSGRLGWTNRKSDLRLSDLTWGPDIQLTAPGFFSRQRMISDRFGRVVATHYEEFFSADHFDDLRFSDITSLVPQRLTLAPGKV